MFPIRSTVSRWLAVISLVTGYLLADQKRNRRSFAIGLVTVFVVVAFLSLIQNALSRANLVFVKLAEDQTGSFDFLMSPDLSQLSQRFLLNYTSINQSLSDVNSIKGTVPRWILPANVTSPASANRNINITAAATVVVMDTAWENRIDYTPLWPYRSLSVGEVHVTASLLRSIGARPNRGDRVLVGINLLQALRNQLNQDVPLNVTNLVPPNFFENGTQTVVIPVDTINQTNPDALPAFDNVGTNNGTHIIIDVDNLDLSVVEDFALSFECTVVDGIEEPYGRYPPSLGNVVVLDKSFAEAILSSKLSDYITNPVLKLFLQASNVGQNGGQPIVDLNSNAFAILVIANNRYSIYTQDTRERQSTLVRLSNAIARAIGIDETYSMIATLSLALDASLFLRIFLNEIFFTVITVLIILAAILMTSLLLADVEEKTFEYGMLRSLGMKQNHLILLVCLQSLCFSVPGVLVGLLFAYVTFIPIGAYLSMFLGIEINVSLDGGAIALGVIAGLALPLVGIVVPIRRALTQTIRDALDVYHNVVFDTQLQVQKLEELGLNVTEIVVSVLLVLIGFLVYYLIPLSFTFGRFDLFFRIMTVILLGMVLGQVLLTQVAARFAQNVTAVLITTLDPSLRQVVLKNLIAHMDRNRKTSLMFTLCIGYMIFVGTMFTLQSRSLGQNVRWIYGADIKIAGTADFKPLPVDRLRSFLDSQKALKEEERTVVDYTFTTYPLNTFFAISSASISRLASVRASTVQIIGLERNFLNATFNTYAFPSQVRELSFAQTLDGTDDYVDALYQSLTEPISAPPNAMSVPSSASGFKVYGTRNNNEIYSNPVPILLSESIRDTSSMDADEPVVLSVSYLNESTSITRTYYSWPAAMMRKFPGYPGIIRFQTRNTPLFLSIPNYKRILDDIVSDLNVTKTSVNMGNLFVRLRSDATNLAVEDIVNDLNSALGDSDFTVGIGMILMPRVTNLREQLASTDSAASLINYVFYIVALIGVILSFFVLLLSFNANIRENSWEIGVLRAIGLSKNQVTRLYIYEAISIIVACIVLGAGLGIFTASTVTLQSNLFSEMPFMFYFPSGLFLLVVSSALALAVVGSYQPITEFNCRPIAITLRGG